MSLVADLTVRSTDGTAVATALRRNLVVHSGIPDVPYFLLVSQETGFLWKHAASPESPPTTSFPMGAVIERYIPSAGVDERLRGEQLELIVLQWLADLAADPNVPAGEPEDTLASCGFLDAIRGARVAQQDEL
jgi:hypothetical protein